MLLAWLNTGPAGTRNTTEDTAKLALHVLISAGFGISYPFHGGVQELSPGHTMTCGDALSLILRNIVSLIVLPKKYLKSRAMPRKLQKLGQAAQEFKSYMDEMVDHERDRIRNHEAGEDNLMTVLVRASEASRQASKSTLTLADDEVFGNIFTFAFAGHETTANTVAFALVLLAANPQCQEWLAEEISHVLGENGSPEAQKYEEVFPKLKRCLAVMVSHCTLKIRNNESLIPVSTRPCAFMVLLSSFLKPLDYILEPSLLRGKSILSPPEQGLASISSLCILIPAFGVQIP